MIIGDKMIGKYESFSSRRHDFGDGEKTMNEYTFLDAKGSEQVLSASPALHKQLQKAQLQRGEKVLIQIKAQIPTEKGNPQNVFRVVVDDGKPDAPKADSDF